MKIICDYCGSEFNKKPSCVKKENYCNKQCRKAAKWVSGNCSECGTSVSRLRCQTPNTDNILCSLECLRSFNSKRFTGMNLEMNPDRMIPETREKLRNYRLGTGEGKAYTKVYGRHEHRIVAEKCLGRPLKKGEVVHHIDEDKRNNHPLL